VSVPIVNVNYQLSYEKDGETINVPSGAQKEFESFLGQCYGHHPKAQF
jgi:hypothetical protein